MKIFSSLHLLAALGVLGAATGASAQVDTSQWKCTSCPYPKGTTGSVDAGVGYVSDSSQKFGDYTGLDEQGRVPGPRRQRQPARRRRLLRRPVGRRPGPRQSPALRPGRPRRPLFPERRLCRDTAPPDRRREDAVHRQRRQRADAPAGLSGRRHDQHAARQHAAADRHRLQLQALRSRRHLHRRAGLERQPEPAPRRARRDTAGVGIVLLHRVAARRAGEREDRRGRAHAWPMRPSSCRRR